MQRFKNTYVNKFTIVIMLVLYLSQQVLSLSSVSPIYNPNSNFQARSIQIKNGANTVINVSTSITVGITFTSTFTAIPRIAFGIIKYSGIDQINKQIIDITKLSLSATALSIKVSTQTGTSMRGVSIRYLAMNKFIPYHVNLFSQIDGNYLAGAITNVTSGGGNREYVNIVNYTLLANSISSTYNKFIGTQFNILLFINSMEVKSGAGSSFVKLKAIAYRFNNSIDRFLISLKVYDGYQINSIKFSIIVYDKGSLASNTAVFYGQNFILNAQKQNYLNIKDLKSSNINTLMFGIIQFEALSSVNSMDFWMDYMVTTNQLYVAKSNTSNSASTALLELTFNVFFIKQWSCPPTHQYYNNITDLCQDYCSNLIFNMNYTGNIYMTITPLCYFCHTHNIRCNSCCIAHCTGCEAGYFLNTTYNCSACTDIFPFCLQCTGTACQVCETGYYVDSDDNCSSCVGRWGSTCLECTKFNCTLWNMTCPLGQYRPNPTSACITNQCGDGYWLYLVQDCDDGNLDNNDGCNQFCQVQNGFTCSLTNMVLPLNTSVCKYNQQVKLNLLFVSKEPDSNTAHLYFQLIPSSLKFWNTGSISTLISSIDFVQYNDPLNIQIIPTQNIQVGANKKIDLSYEVEVTVKYQSESSLQNGFVRYNLAPAATGISAFQGLSPTNNIFSLVTLTSHGQYLYNYSQNDYGCQKFVSVMSLIIGIFCILFILAGFLIPHGKLIVIQSLAVIQITYFSILHFTKIPSAYIGFRNLVLSSGFNMINSSNQNNRQVIDVFDLLGFNVNMVENYNISFILLFFTPLFIAILGHSIIKICFQNPQSTKNQTQNYIEDGQNLGCKKEDLKKHKIRKNKIALVKIILTRMAHQTAFYGLMVCGYLAWVSIFHSFVNFQGLSIAFAVLITIFWLTYGYRYLKKDSQLINLNQLNKIKKTSKPSTNKKSPYQILSLFGQFHQLQLNLKNAQNKQNYKINKIWFVFIVQRFITSLIVIFSDSQSIFLVSLLLIFMYLGLLLATLVMFKINNKEQKSYQLQQQKKQQKPKILIFSQLHNNYALRQSINFLTLILVQFLLFIAGAVFQSQGSYPTFVKNIFVSRIIPILVIFLLLISLCWNIFLWVTQIKESNLIQKAKKIMSIMSQNPNMQLKLEQINEKDKQKNADYQSHRKMVNKMDQQNGQYQSNNINDMSNIIKHQKNIQQIKSQQNKSNSQSNHQSNDNQSNNDSNDFDDENSSKKSQSKKTKKAPKIISAMQLEYEYDKIMNSMLETSGFYRNDSSPFLGICQKTNRQSLLTNIKSPAKGNPLNSSLLSDPNNSIPQILQEEI